MPPLYSKRNSISIRQLQNQTRRCAFCFSRNLQCPLPLIVQYASSRDLLRT